MILRTGVLALAAAAFLFLGTGCANNKLTAERDSLANQNKELADQLKAEREARQLAEARASSASGQLAALPANPAPDMGGVVDLSNPRPIGGARGTTPVSRNTTPSPKAVATKVTIPGNIHFDSGKVTLNAAATKELDTMVATIKGKYAAGVKLMIEGFADNTPLSKTSVWTSNTDLAKARATAVKNYLVKKGIPAANITVKGSTTSTTGAASRKAEVQVTG